MSDNEPNYNAQPMTSAQLAKHIKARLDDKTNVMHPLIKVKIDLREATDESLEKLFQVLHEREFRWIDMMPAMPVRQGWPKDYIIITGDKFIWASDEESFATEENAVELSVKAYIESKPEDFVNLEEGKIKGASSFLGQLDAIQLQQELEPAQLGLIGSDGVATWHEKAFDYYHVKIKIQEINIDVFKAVQQKAIDAGWQWPTGKELQTDRSEPVMHIYGNGYILIGEDRKEMNNENCKIMTAEEYLDVDIATLKHPSPTDESRFFWKQP